MMSVAPAPSNLHRCLEAVRARPTDPTGHIAFGVALLANRHPIEAFKAFKKALELEPTSSAAWFNLGNTCYELSRFAEAVRAYHSALRHGADEAGVLNNLGSALGKVGAREEALHILERALTLRPELLVFNNYGNALTALDRHEEAIACFDKILSANSDSPGTYYNRGTSLRLANRLTEAVADFSRALTLCPGYSGAEWNMALALLAAGSYEEGWRAYESRWHKREAKPLQEYGKVVWRGEPIAAGTAIIVQGEQGFGDTIQFSRYLHILQKRGMRCLMQVRPGLEGLLARSFPGVEVVSEKAPLSNPEIFGWRCPLLSLPLACATFLEPDIPAQTPYLQADEGLVGKWAQSLAAAANGKKMPTVGLVWRGSPTHLNDRNRSLELLDLLPLLSLSGICWAILQKELTIKERDWLLQWPDVAFVSDHLANWDETAALMPHLDLVISVDTAVAHLAGAMRRPTWLLLPHTPDWRWQLGRSDSPWYPGMRLYRQTIRGRWGDVLETVAKNLQRF